MTAPGRHGFPVTASEVLHVGKVLAVRVDTVVMPGGRPAAREVVEAFGAVAIVPVDDDGTVVLVDQYRPAVARRLRELPAGLLDAAGEDPAATAQRELREEAGLAARDWSLLVDVCPSPGFTDESVRVYLARGLTGVDRPAGEDDEESDLAVVRVPLDEAVRDALAGGIVNGVTVAGLLAARAVLDGVARPRPLDAPWTTPPTRFAARREG